MDNLEVKSVVARFSDTEQYKLATVPEDADSLDISYLDDGAEQTVRVSLSGGGGGGDYSTATATITFTAGKDVIIPYADADIEASVPMLMFEESGTYEVQVILYKGKAYAINMSGTNITNLSGDVVHGAGGNTTVVISGDCAFKV